MLSICAGRFNRLAVYSNQIIKCLSSAAAHSLRKHTSIVLSDEVEAALKTGHPVVALESTIITHGMPYPENVDTAIQVESIVKAQGCIPATIAVINGIVRVGLSHSTLEALAKNKENLKLGKRDIPFAVLKSGGTTVSATSFIASLCQIPVFVTGGIGGVHYGWSDSMDVSADLHQIQSTPIAIVCSGVKLILDISKTLECLETLGIPVVTLGSDSNFPAFYLSNSGFHSSHHLETHQECAELMDTHFRLGNKSGMIIAVPIPDTEQADELTIKNAIQKAQQLANREGYTGKQITPFLLKSINEITDGKALRANISLIKNNAMLGSRIAKEYSRIVSETTPSYQ